VVVAAASASFVVVASAIFLMSCVDVQPYLSMV
jgi:hypothetical protein